MSDTPTPMPAVNIPPSPPIVLCFAGMDPSGGAGLQADIETLSSMGIHAATVVTALTVQDTQGLMRYDDVDVTLVIEQARAILEDMPVAAIKIGMIGSVENAEAIHTILMDYPNLPVVLDPLVSAGGGGDLGDDDMLDAMANLLFPLASIITPNSEDARIFAPEADSLDACAMELLEMGSEYVLITGTHEGTPNVVNNLYCENRIIESYTWERLPTVYHGSGCTLAAAITALLAQGMEAKTAINEAQEYTWEALRSGYRPGMGQAIPDRFYWAHGDDE